MVQAIVRLCRLVVLLVVLHARRVSRSGVVQWYSKSSSTETFGRFFCMYFFATICRTKSQILRRDCCSLCKIGVFCLVTEFLSRIPKTQSPPF